MIIALFVLTYFIVGFFAASYVALNRQCMNSEDFVEFMFLWILAFVPFSFVDAIFTPYLEWLRK